MNRTVTLGGLIATVVTTLALSLAISVGAANYLDTPGPRGASGVQGVQGEQGTKGTRGKRGASGFNGANGATIVREEACSNDLRVPLPYC